MKRGPGRPTKEETARREYMWYEKGKKFCPNCQKFRPKRKFCKAKNGEFGLCITCSSCQKQAYEKRSKSGEIAEIVYVLQHGSSNFYKIGCCTKLDHQYRIGRMQLGNPIPLVTVMAAKVKNASGSEARLHRLFRSQRAIPTIKRGHEWFELSPEDLQRVEEFLGHCGRFKKPKDTQPLTNLRRAKGFLTDLGFS